MYGQYLFFILVVLASVGICVAIYLSWSKKCPVCETCTACQPCTACEKCAACQPCNIKLVIPFPGAGADNKIELYKQAAPRTVDPTVVTAKGDFVSGICPTGAYFGYVETGSFEAQNLHTITYCVNPPYDIQC